LELREKWQLDLQSSRVVPRNRRHTARKKILTFRENVFGYDRGQRFPSGKKKRKGEKGGVLSTVP